MLLSLPGESRSNENLVNRSQVERLLSDYFDMLKDGYTSGVLDLLTGPMLKCNENLLKNNPGYADLLRERYKNSNFVITNYKRIDSRKLATDVMIRLNTQEEIRVRFTLLEEGDRLKIYAEEEISTLGSNHE
jgi:hypothetical protein